MTCSFVPSLHPCLPRCKKRSSIFWWKPSGIDWTRRPRRLLWRLQCWWQSWLWIKKYWIRQWGFSSWHDNRRQRFLYRWKRRKETCHFYKLNVNCCECRLILFGIWEGQNKNSGWLCWKNNKQTVCQAYQDLSPHALCNYKLRSARIIVLPIYYHMI